MKLWTKINFKKILVESVFELYYSNDRTTYC